MPDFIYIQFLDVFKLNKLLLNTPIYMYNKIRSRFSLFASQLKVIFYAKMQKNLPCMYDLDKFSKVVGIFEAYNWVFKNLAALRN